MYPALVVLQALAGNSDNPGLDVARSVLWVGGIGGMEEDLVKRAGVPFEAISAAGLHGVGLAALPGNLWQLQRGFQQARGILRRFRPDVLFFTGGFVAAPVALAGRGIPSVVYVPDIEPGLALKGLARFAHRIAVTTEDSRAYFSDQAKVTVTGYPVRPELSAWQPDAARQALGLGEDLPTLLVFGGSKGARSINQSLLACLPELLAEMQIVHVSGQLDWPEVEAARQKLLSGPQPDLAGRYRPFPYLHAEMGAAFTVADLVVCRAGASTLGELPLFGLPAILVPYPYAWRYQQVNAQWVARHGAAMVLADAGLPAQLLPAVRDLIRDPGRRAAMRQAMHSLARPQAAHHIAALLHSLAAGNSQGGRPQ